MVRKTPLAFALCTLLTAAPQAFASFDMEDCKWSDDSCLLKGTPTFNPENDSRDKAGQSGWRAPHRSGG